MQTSRILTATKTLIVGILLAWSRTAALAELPGKLTEDEAAKIAADAYVYGYPLVLMDVSRQVMTAVSKPTTTAAPINQFNDSKEFPDATFTNVVSPNADTLYSFSWLDLAKEPLVLSLPEMGDRYYLMQMLDGWTNVFASPGTRTTGSKKGDYAIVGPNFRGQAARGRQGDQIADEPGVDHRPHADERQSGFRSRLRSQSPVQAHATLRLG